VFIGRCPPFILVISVPMSHISVSKIQEILEFDFRLPGAQQSLRNSPYALDFVHCMREARQTQAGLEDLKKSDVIVHVSLRPSAAELFAKKTSLFFYFYAYDIDTTLYDIDTTCIRH